MDGNDRLRLVEVMTAMADDDAAAVVCLFREFGEPIGAAVRRALRTVHATHLGAEDVEALVFDVCDDLRLVAGSWSPDGGALPWVWAERRILSLVARAAGQYADSWDDERHGAGMTVLGPGDGDESGPDLDEEAVLALLAAGDSRCALLEEGLARAASPRDRAVFLLAEHQEAMGDPSPSHTVAAAFGMTAPAVRKAVQRVRARLSALADTDARFEPLRHLHIVSRCSAA